MSLTSKFVVLLTVSLVTLSLFAAHQAQNTENLEHVANLEDELECGYTADFTAFLDKNGYKDYKFDRPDLKCGAYGGKKSDSQKIKKAPIIFVHGNSDVAFGRGSADGYVSWQTGFRSLATYLISQGYDKSELYTTTWGPADPNQAQNNFHSKAYVMQNRKFIEAVLAYTNAKEVVVIGHSMGVSLGRKAIKGGSAEDHSAGTYDVGASLAHKVKTFTGLAGANYGLTACFSSAIAPTCNQKDGFFPGALPTSGPSKYLNDVNINNGKEAENVYTIWSKFDDLIGMGTLVWGKSTCRIAYQTSEVVKTTA